MELRKTEYGYFLKFNKDEKIHKILEQFMRDQKINAAFYHGLGALKNAELGFYHLNKKEYHRQIFREEAELLNMTGSLTWFNDQPVVHSHVTLGDPQFKAFGGHLFEADVAVTVELMVTVFKEKIERVPDADIGLNMISFCPIK
jgi:predicted DNA-binding protein with PD1-like motif